MLLIKETSFVEVFFNRRDTLKKFYIMNRLRLFRWIIYPVSFLNRDKNVMHHLLKGNIFDIRQCFCLLPTGWVRVVLITIATPSCQLCNESKMVWLLLFFPQSWFSVIKTQDIKTRHSEKVILQRVKSR